MKPVIRQAVMEDVTALSILGQKTFTDTFGGLYSSQDLQKFLCESQSPAYYAELINAQKVCLWVADIDGHLGGYIIFGHNSMDVSAFSGTAATEQGEIKRLYVDGAFHGQGIAQSLMAKAMAWFETMKVSEVYLSVFSENYRAQKFYEKYHFTKLGEHGFPVGEQIDLDYIYGVKFEKWQQLTKQI